MPFNASGTPPAGQHHQQFDEIPILAMLTYVIQPIESVFPWQQTRKVMTEADWDSAQAPASMLDLLVHRASPRKWRLFACGCCRRVWSLLHDRTMRECVEMAEDYADGLASEQALAAACRQGWETWSNWPRIDPFGYKAISAAAWVAKPVVALEEATIALQCSLKAECRLEPEDAIRDRCNLIREVFGNPFRRTVVPAGSSGGLRTVRELAESIYDDPRFEDLPALAEALLDAGCHDERIMSHCREPGPHVRGCWVVDLLLGKE
jgi:hypothetical protein